MHVKGVRWIGVRTDRYEELRAFAVDVLGLRVVSESGGVERAENGLAWQHFRAPDGRVYELTYDPDA